MENMKNHNSEEHREELKKWLEWKKKNTDNIVDFGWPIWKSYKVTSTKAKQESNMIGGYSILQAENINEANKLISTNPHLQNEDWNYAEVTEIMPVM